MNKLYKKTKALLIIAIAILITLFVMLIVFATTQHSLDWYLSLNIPRCLPPDWLFGIIKTTLFILVAASAIIVLFEKRRKKKYYNFAICLFLINALFGTLFSLLFFGIKNVLYAFIELPFLIAAALLLIWYVYLVNKKAAYLLIPYLGWVIYLTIITGIILFYN